MEMIPDKMFFGLLRVVVGSQDALPGVLTEAEWEELFDIAMKQSVVGVCFTALHILGADSDDGYAQIGMSEDLFFNWMGLAAQINMKNETVNQQCAELQAKIANDGFRSCILKGQGVAALYGEDLRGFRQSGDIDLYVDCGRKRALDYLRSHGMKALDWDYVHVHPKFYEDTDVEMHYRVSVAHNLIMNNRLQKFFKENNEELFSGTSLLPEGSIVVPSNWMNLFYLIQHSYRHLFTEGIGMRQVMDIYFASKTLTLSNEDIQRLKQATARFGLNRFASGMMWVLQHVFGLDQSVLLWEPNQSEGEFLLTEIMQSGNFGKLDRRFGDASGSKAGKLASVLRRAWHLASRYTGEAISAPFYYVWHFLWKRITLLTD